MTLRIHEGEFVVIFGSNGSGKSTFAKHLNALLLPSEGVVLINGKNTQNENELTSIHQDVGMVFQNPDNQIIGTSVEEDLAFGPENRNIDPQLIAQRIATSLQMVGLVEQRLAAPHNLSGGQKQRIAIAGVLVCDTHCIVLDEPTSMLDPCSRKQILGILHKLHDAGKTIVLITHNAEEATRADRIVVMGRGKIVAEGTPADVFSNADYLQTQGVDVPQVSHLSGLLAKYGIPDNATRLMKSQLVEDLLSKVAPMENPLNGENLLAETVSKTAETQRYCESKEEASLNRTARTRQTVDQHKDSAHTYPTSKQNEPPLFEMHDINFAYNPKTDVEQQVLKGISLRIEAGEYIAIIGTSGSGKTTLVKHLNGLLRAHSGVVLFKGENIYHKHYSLTELRTHVGLVYQHPESQLFRPSVIDDVSFGPKNLGVDPQEALERARQSLKLVGIDERYFQLSPFDLSGAQMRRVAIADVLAMRPSILVMDEPAASLDPRSKAEMFKLIDDLRAQDQLTVVLVSHDVNDVAEHAERVLLLDNGKIAMDGTPVEVFGQVELIRSFGLDVPLATEVLYDLSHAGLPITHYEVTLTKAASAIARAYQTPCLQR